MKKPRRLSPGRLFAKSTLSIIVLLGPACSGSGEEPGQTGTRPARTDAASEDSDREGERPVLVLTPVTPAPAPQAPPVAAAPPAAPGGQRRPAPGTAPPGVPSVVPPSPPAAATYLFSETGVTKIRGCLTLDQPPPSPTKLVAGPASGNRQHVDRDQRDPLGSGSLTSADLEYRPDGIYLNRLRQTQTSLLSSQPTEFEPNPPALLLPAGAVPGHTWSLILTSKDGGVKIDSQNRVEAADEPVTLTNGQAVSTRRIVADSRITGQSSQGTLDLMRKMTTWYAPQNGLPVKEIVDMKGRVGLCDIDSHIESTLQSL